MRKIRRAIRLAFILLLGASIFGCSKPDINTNPTSAPIEQGTEENSNTLSYSEFDVDQYPNYVKLYDIPCTVDVDLNPGEIEFSELDELGRSGRAVGRITLDMVEESAGWRTEFAPNSDPSGWGHNAEVTIPYPNGGSYHGWLYNRSHLIADSLGGYTHVYTSSGDIDEEQSTTPKTNLVTGTRTQNVGENNGDGGMQYFESRTIEYLKANPDESVWYSARPVYEGDELVPRSVIVSAKSDNGGFDVVGEVFNCANGIDIDYATGEWTYAD